MMKLFDTHCDTLTQCYDNQYKFSNTKTQINISSCRNFSNWIQVFAIFIKDNLRGQDAIDYFINVKEYFKKSLKEDSNLIHIKTPQDLQNNLLTKKCGAMLSVEGGAMLSGDINNFHLLTDAEVKIFTLTWNGENEIAYGASCSCGKIKPFGIELIKKLEENKIIVDVSHLNDEGFWQLSEIAKRPFIATHSNARSICENKRNLDDKQLKFIFENDGLVGINFYPVFIKNNSSLNFYDELYKHIQKMIHLGGKNNICIGSDFDGADMCGGIENLDMIYTLQDYLLSRGYKDKDVENIFYNNAYNFFKKYL